MRKDIRVVPRHPWWETWTDYDHEWSWAMPLKIDIDWQRLRDIVHAYAGDALMWTYWSWRVTIQWRGRLWALERWRDVEPDPIFKARIETERARRGVLP